MDSEVVSTITAKQVNGSQIRYKRDLTVYKYFDGGCRMWFMCKRNWHSNAVNDRIEHRMDNKYTVPPDGTETKTLYGS
eukprot:3362981-Ditylum_brightwellii.AAC.1